ncbi:hypothetical protein, partial [Bifidobacterium bifidum]|uniref:hypothetical protein n=1 Tax=Bifidobacterium bifidum TaxID=1681 RepID=UPI00321A3A00
RLHFPGVEGRYFDVTRFSIGCVADPYAGWQSSQNSSRVTCRLSATYFDYTPVRRSTDPHVDGDGRVVGRLDAHGMRCIIK